MVHYLEKQPKIRKQLLEQDMLEAVIGLGPHRVSWYSACCLCHGIQTNKPADKKR